MNKKLFPTILFLTNLSKTIVGIFNVIYLYKLGFSYLNVLLWQMIVYVMYIFLAPITASIGNKIGHKKVMIASVFFFIVTYLYLNYCVANLTSMCIYAVLFGIFGSCFWMPRHYFEFQQINDKKIGNKVGLFLIISKLATILSSLLSAFVLDHSSIFVLIILSYIIMGIAMIFMFFLPENKCKEKINIKEFFKITPKQTLFHITLKEANTILSTFFSLYLFIYVSSTYSFAGITNVLLGIASMIFTYCISKKLDKKRNEYLLLSVVLLCLVYLFKINIASSLIIVIIFGEGLIQQFFSSVMDTNYYTAGNLEHSMSFITGHECYTNVMRVVICLIGLLLGDFTKFIYFCIGFIVLSGFVPYKIENNKN